MFRTFQAPLLAAIQTFMPFCFSDKTPIGKIGYAQPCPVSIVKDKNFRKCAFRRSHFNPSSQISGKAKNE